MVFSLRRRLLWRNKFRMLIISGIRDNGLGNRLLSLFLSL